MMAFSKWRTCWLKWDGGFEPGCCRVPFRRWKPVICHDRKKAVTITGFNQQHQVKPLTLESDCRITPPILQMENGVAGCRTVSLDDIIQIIQTGFTWTKLTKTYWFPPGGTTMFPVILANKYSLKIRPILENDEPFGILEVHICFWVSRPTPARSDNLTPSAQKIGDFCRL